MTLLDSKRFKAAAQIGAYPRKDGNLALQALAKACLTGVLENNNQPVEALVAKQQTVLIKALLPTHLASYGFRKQKNRLMHQFPLTAPDLDGDVVALYAANNNPAGWITATLDKLAAFIQRDRARGPLGANHFADALAQESWQGPAFCTYVAGQIRDSLTETVLFHPDPPPHPLIAPETWWILIDQALPEVRRKHSAARRLRDVLAKRAEAAKQAANWAGFWDAYLLEKAHQNCNHDFNATLWQHVCRVLRAESKPKIHSALLPDWQTHTPSYAAQMINGHI